VTRHNHSHCLLFIPSANSVWASACLHLDDSSCSLTHWLLPPSCMRRIASIVRVDFAWYELACGWVWLLLFATLRCGRVESGARSAQRWATGADPAAQIQSQPSAALCWLSISFDTRQPPPRRTPAQWIRTFIPHLLPPTFCSCACPSVSACWRCSCRRACSRRTTSSDDDSSRQATDDSRAACTARGRTRERESKRGAHDRSVRVADIG